MESGDDFIASLLNNATLAFPVGCNWTDTVASLCTSCATGLHLWGSRIYSEDTDA